MRLIAGRETRDVIRKLQERLSHNLNIIQYHHQSGSRGGQNPTPFLTPLFIYLFILFIYFFVPLKAKRHSNFFFFHGSKSGDTPPPTHCGLIAM